MVRLVDDKKVPATVDCLLAAQGVIRQKIDITENELPGLEGIIVATRDFILATLFIEQTEPQVETPQHLDEPLMLQ